MSRIHRTHTEPRGDKPQRERVTLAAGDIVRGENLGRYKSAGLDKIAALAESIKNHGQLAPCLVRKSTDGKYHLVAGFTRVAACEKLGIGVTCDICDVTEQYSIDASIEENIRRSDLTLIDKASIMQRLRDRGDTTRDVGVRLNCTQAWVVNCCKLLKLPEQVRDCIATGRLAGSAGLALTKLKDDDEIMAVMSGAISVQPNISGLKDSKTIDAAVLAGAIYDPSAADQKASVESYDSGKILKEVAKRVAKFAPEGEGGGEGGGEGEGEGGGEGETTKKPGVAKLVADFMSTIQRGLNDAPHNPEFRMFCEALRDYFAGGNIETFEVAYAEYGGFKTSDLYSGDETVGAAK